MGVSFEAYLRRLGDLLIGRRHYIPLRRRHDIPIRSRKDVPLRHLGDVPLRRHWVFHLRHTCDVAGTYRETSTASPQRRVAGWEISLITETKLKPVISKESTSSLFGF